MTPTARAITLLVLILLFSSLACTTFRDPGDPPPTPPFTSTPLVPTPTLTVEPSPTLTLTPTTTPGESVTTEQ
jgi:hypothetical protein